MGKPYYWNRKPQKEAPPPQAGIRNVEHDEQRRMDGLTRGFAVAALDRLGAA